MEEILKSLAAQGPLGILALLEAYALVRVYQDYKAALQQSASTSATALEAIKAMKDENKELNDLVRSLSAALRQTPSSRS